MKAYFEGLRNDNRLIGLAWVSLAVFLSLLSIYAVVDNKLLLVMVFGVPISLIFFFRPLWGLYILVALIPFQLFPMAFFGSPYTFSVCQVLVKLLFAITVLRVVGSRRFSFASSPLNLWIVLFILVAFLSTLYTSDMREHLKGTIPNVVDLFLLYFVVTNNIRTRDQLRKLVNILVGVSAIVAAIGTLQYLGGLGVIERYLRSDFVSLFAGPGYAQLRVGGMLRRIRLGGFDIVTSIFVNSSDYGGFLLYLFPVCCALSLAEKTPRMKVLYGVVTLLFAFNLIVCLSRSAWLGLAAAVIFLGFVSLRRNNRLAAAVVAIVLLSVVIGGIVGYSSYMELLPSTVQSHVLETIREGTAARSYQVRVGWWHESLFKVSKMPLLGTTTLFKTHNLYIEILLLFGLVGLLFYLVIMGVTLHQLFRTFTYSDNNYLKGISIGVCASLIGLLFHSLFWNDLFFVPQNDMLFALFLGLAVVTAMIGGGKESENEFTTPRFTLARFRVVRVIFGISLFASLLIAILNFSAFDIFSYGAFAAVILLTPLAIRKVKCKLQVEPE